MLCFLYGPGEPGRYAAQETMSQASEKITELYTLSQNDFEQQLRVRVINLRRQLLTDLLTSPGDEPQTILAEVSRLFVVAQKQISQDANITEEQRTDFESRTDNLVADAVVTIERCIQENADWRSPEFQIDCATRLEIPIAT